MHLGEGVNTWLIQHPRAEGHAIWEKRAQPLLFRLIPEMLLVHTRGTARQVGTQLAHATHASANGRPMAGARRSSRPDMLDWSSRIPARGRGMPCNFEDGTLNFTHSFLHAVERTKVHAFLISGKRRGPGGKNHAVIGQ